MGRSVNARLIWGFTFLSWDDCVPEIESDDEDEFWLDEWEQVYAERSGIVPVPYVDDSVDKEAYEKWLEWWRTVQATADESGVTIGRHGYTQDPEQYYFAVAESEMWASWGSPLELVQECLDVGDDWEDILVSAADKLGFDLRDVQYGWRLIAESD